jgi:hypothetical protein
MSEGRTFSQIRLRSPMSEGGERLAKLG